VWRTVNNKGNNVKKTGNMEQNYSDMELASDIQPTGVYYTPASHRATRRQQKHELLLTFMKHANTPPPKRKHRTAPVKPTLLHTLLSLFV